MKQGIMLCTLINLQLLLACDLRDDKKNFIIFLRNALKQ